MKMYTLILQLLVLLFVSCSGSTDEPEIPETPEVPEIPEVPEVPNPDPLYEWTSEDLVLSVEAETGEFQNVRNLTTEAGYSGAGYLGGFYSDKDYVTITVDVPERAMYRLKIIYLAKGKNSHYIIIDDKDKESAMVNLPVSSGFQSMDMGKYLLNKGTNQITFRGGWGDVLIDKFNLYTSPQNTYNIDPELVDAGANAETRQLYQYLLDNFGKKMISGFLERKPLEGITDRSPALYGWDFSPYTDGYTYNWKDDDFAFGAVDNGSVQSAINWYISTNRQGIVTFHWHWHSPSGSRPGVNAFYTENTTFKVTEAVKSGTEENRLILRDIDAIALQLKKLEAAGVPVLWRPLHEAGGTWFWWGAEGPEACVELYNILYDRLQNHHQLHNLVWVWSTNEPEWYPGNDKVDIIGYDSYPGAYNTGVQPFMFNTLYALTEGEKIIAMTENGPIPSPDACFEQDAPWAFFMAWNDLLYEHNASQHIYDVYHNNNVITFK